MSASDRRRPRPWILVSAAVFVLYGITLGRRSLLDLGAAKAMAEDARQKAVPPGTMEAEERRVGDLEKETAALRTSVQPGRGSPGAAPAGPDRSGTGRRLTLLLAEHGLLLLDESVDPESTAAPLPEFLRQVAPGEGGPALRSVRISGRYADVLDALDRVADEGLPVVPVRIRMSRAAGEGANPSWTFVVWM